MKKLFGLRIFLGLILSLFIPEIAFSQAGLTNPGTTQEQERSQSGNGFDTGTKSGSALQQLENISGGKVTGTNTDHNIVTPPQRTKTSNAAKTISSAALFQNTMKMQLASGIASAFFGMLFSDNSNNQQVAEAQRQQAVELAERAAEEKRIADLIEQEKYEKMMQSYKLLNDPLSIQFKTLSTNNTQFKSLDYQSAPMTMEDRQLQNLRKKGISVTWDYSSWANISPNRNMIEEANTREESEEDKQLDAVIEKHESDDGGREAAAAGRFMKNFKTGTMSYLNDVAKAVGSGDMASIEELGQRDPAKIVSNAIYDTGVQTGKALIAEGKGFITGMVKEKNMAIMKNGVTDLLQKDMPEEWKMPLRP